MTTEVEKLKEELESCRSELEFERRQNEKLLELISTTDLEYRIKVQSQVDRMKKSFDAICEHLRSEVRWLQSDVQNLRGNLRLYKTDEPKQGGEKDDDKGNQTQI